MLIRASQSPLLLDDAVCEGRHSHAIFRLLIRRHTMSFDIPLCCHLMPLRRPIRLITSYFASRRFRRPSPPATLFFLFATPSFDMPCCFRLSAILDIRLRFLRHDTEVVRCVRIDMRLARCLRRRHAILQNAHPRPPATRHVTTMNNDNVWGCGSAAVPFVACCALFAAD